LLLKDWHLEEIEESSSKKTEKKEKTKLNQGIPGALKDSKGYAM